MTQDSSLSITNSAKSSFLGTLLSRFGGMARDVTMAFFFGSSPHIAAFMIAFRVANLFRRLLGEGTLTSGFIPHFEHLRVSDPKKSAFFYRDLLFSFSLFLVAVISVSETALIVWYRNFASLALKEILLYVMLMMPGLLFVCLYSLSSSFLQCHRKFFLPASAPAVFNVLWVGMLYYFHRFEPTHAIIYLSIGVVFAFFMQWLFTFGPSLRCMSGQLSLREWLSPSWFSKDLSVLLKPISLSVIGAGAVQINSALDTFFARAADIQGPAYLWYAMRFYQLPLALFGIALSGALLPPLARAVKEENIQKYKQFIQHAIKQSLSLMIPATLGIVALGAVGLNLVYGRGEFGEDTLIQTTKSLWAYGSGLLAATWVLIFSSAFYARKEFGLPAFISLLSVLLNVFLNTLFVYVLKQPVASVAWATSISAYFNMALLGYFLVKRVGPIFDRNSIVLFAKIVLISFSSAAVALLGAKMISDPTLAMIVGSRGNLLMSFPREFVSQVMHFGFMTSLFFFSLFGGAYLLGAKEIFQIIFRHKKTADNL